MRSRETQLISTTQDFTRTTDNKGQTDVILLDFPKVFIKVPHQRLQHKLNIMASHPKYIADFFMERNRVVIEGDTIKISTS